MLRDKNLIEWLDLPHEPGQSVGIIRLTGPELDDASAAATRKVFARFKGADPDLFRLFAGGDKKTNEDAEKAAAGADEAEVRRGSYDDETLVMYGLAAWSYTTDAGEPIPVTDERKRSLDAPTMKFVADALFERNVVPFASGNGSATS